MTKGQLIYLIDQLSASKPESISECIAFLKLDTREVWHNRARAKMCRRLKHVQLSQEYSQQILQIILEKFKTGNITQQFRDMLRLALLIDPKSTLTTAMNLAKDKRQYVNRQAEWLITHHDLPESH